MLMVKLLIKIHATTKLFLCKNIGIFILYDTLEVFFKRVLEKLVFPKAKKLCEQMVQRMDTVIPALQIQVPDLASI